MLRSIEMSAEAIPRLRDGTSYLGRLYLSYLFGVVRQMFTNRLQNIAASLRTHSLPLVEGGFADVMAASTPLGPDSAASATSATSSPVPGLVTVNASSPSRYSPLTNTP